MAMISQEGAPSLKVSFQITHVLLDKSTAEITGHNQRETSRSLHSSQVEEGNEITDFRQFLRILYGGNRLYPISRFLYVLEAPRHLESS